MADLKETIAFVDRNLAAYEKGAGTYKDDPAGWHKRHRVQMRNLADRLRVVFGARITERGDLTRVRLGGVAASSTGGMASALRNWLAAARKKPEALP